MAKKKIVTNDYPFYDALLDFYNFKKNSIRKSYKDVSRKILDFNDKEKNPNAFLRKPQFEALEIYVLIKEFLNNQSVKDMFADWYNHKGRFEMRDPYSRKTKSYTSIGMGNLFDDITADVYNDVFDMLSNQNQKYPNYIYALTMGTGKTILMATCIFYEFILVSKYPKDKRFCHNVLVFAPDKTVLQSLKEIKTFDFKKVIPTEYVSFLAANVKFHFLDDNSTTLNTIDGSDYNIIISNTQKIILKEVHKEKNAVDKFMNDSYEQVQLELEGLDDFTKKLYGDLDSLKDEKEVTANQRFEKIIRLNQLGVYVDEAHHLFGTDLKKSLSDDNSETSLRYTINKIAEVLEKRSTKLVACYNYTGTPYVENKILPEVVYAYELNDAIRNGYLKEVEIQGYDNVKNEEFLRRILTHFFKYYGDNLYEGLKPKIAIFGAEIKEVTNEIKPIVEGILNDLGIDISTILVNVGDSTITKDADIKDFNDLDVIGTHGSQKQVLLLVNKGREGWNCRSLFSVALYRSPKSKIFVLQSTMRCLRSISETQQIAHVYLSSENYKILDDELRKNFNIDIKDMTDKTDNKVDYLIKIVPPVKELSLEEIRKSYTLKSKKTHYPMKFDINKIDVEKYKSKLIVKKGIDTRFGESKSEFISDENKPFSKYTIVFEVSRYLNEEPLKIREILEKTGCFDKIKELITQYNDILYDELIPAVFNYLYNIEERIETVQKKVPLIKYGNKADHFVFRTKRELTIGINDPFVTKYSRKSFHVDRYCFDSEPEKRLFMDLIESDQVEEVYFTGMFTGSENGLSVQYIDPESNVIRNYYPDILVFYKNGTVEIVEVKGDNKIDDKVVGAKAWAAMNLAAASKMDYNIYKSSDIMAGRVKITGTKLKTTDIVDSNPKLFDNN